jgi:benzylsuccinate CoA-transferase BbsE subunit
VAQALGGIAWLSGEPGKAPLRLAGEQSIFVASLYAAAATALALWHSEEHGASHVLDVSAQEAIAHSLQNAIQVYDLEGLVSSRGGEGVRDATESAFACKDGYVFLAAPLSLSASWSALLAWLKEERFNGVDRLLEADWKDRPTRATSAMKREFRQLFERFVADKTKAELGAEALNRKIVMAPVSRIADLQIDPQHLFRRFFRKVAMPGLGEVSFPGAPYRLSEALWRIDRAAPRLGEDNEGVLGGIGARQVSR